MRSTGLPSACTYDATSSIVDRVGHGRQMFRSHQQPVLPGARLGNAVWPREHDAASDRETGTAGILDDTGAFVAEHKRRLGPRVFTRQDRVIERRDAGGGDVNQHFVLCRLRLRQFDLPQPATSPRKSSPRSHASPFSMRGSRFP